MVVVDHQHHRVAMRLILLVSGLPFRARQAAGDLGGGRTPAPEELKEDDRRLHVGDSSRDTWPMGEKRRRLAAATAGKQDDRPALALAARATALTPQSAFEPALKDLGRALELAPHLDPLWAQFGELVRFFRFLHPLHAKLRAHLERALQHPAVDPGNLVLPIVSAALSRPPGEVFAKPLLLRLLEDTIVRDAALQDLIAAERRRALEGASVPLDALIAIAHQCFNTEYVLDESEAETTALATLRLAQSADYALYAAYRPLHTLSDAERVAEQLRSEEHTSELQSQSNLVCRLLLEKKKH